MNLILYAVPVFLLTILAEAWVARRRGLAAYDLPDGVTSLQFGLLSQVAAVFTRVLTLGMYVLVYEYARLFELPVNAWWVWVFALVFYDFVYYWVHRLGHEVNLLWAAHQVHHSSEYFNLTTALRQTATGALTNWPFYLVMALFGVPPVVFVVVALVDLLYQYWVHTELVGRLGWLDRVFVTPSNHRVHHGQNDWCIDCNYGGIFIVWDRLFGTFVEERDDERVIYGIRRPLASFNPVWGNLNVYRELLSASRASPSLRAGLGVWLARPSGDRSKLAALDPASVRRFNCDTRPAIRWYVAAQYALLLLAAMYFLAVAPGLGPMERLGCALVLVASTLSLGWLLEERAYAVRLEQLRWITLGALALVGKATLPGLSPILGGTLLVCAIVSLTVITPLGRSRQAVAPAS